MKNITFFICLVMILCCGALPAKGEIRLFNQTYNFTLSGGPGFLYGASYEIVYTHSGAKDYLSELQWNIKPLLYLALNLDFGLKNPLNSWGFFADLGVKAALPMKTIPKRHF